MTVNKARHDITSFRIAELCRPATATHYQSRLRSASCGDLDVPRTRLELGKRAFAVAGPTAWKNFLISVRLASSITTFLKCIYSVLPMVIEISMISLRFIIHISLCKAPLRCLHLRHFTICQYYITLHYYYYDYDYYYYYFYFIYICFVPSVLIIRRVKNIKLKTDWSGYSS